MMRKLIAIAILFAFVPALALPSTLTSRIQAERRKKAEIDRKLHEKKVELHSAVLRVSGFQAELDQTNHSIGVVNSRLDSLASQQAQTQRRLAWNTLR